MQRSTVANLMALTGVVPLGKGIFSGLRSLRRLAVIGALLSGAVTLYVSPASAVLLKSYDFTTDLSDTLGNGVDMTGVGTVSGGRYSFSNNQGLRLTSALPSTTDYAIEMKLQVNDNLSGYKKLVDFLDLGSDIGLYLLDDAVTFYTNISAVGSVSLDTDFVIGLERAAGTISVFLDGVFLASAPDVGDQALPLANILNFFEDDFATGQAESFTGSVDWVRIHSDSSSFSAEPPAVPEPGALAILAFGLAGIGFARRRRASA